jgi:hypothetical protein
VVAVAVGVAEVAEVAVVAAAAAEAAAQRGVSAASAKAGALLSTTSKRETLWPGQTKSTRPIHVIFMALRFQSRRGPNFRDHGSQLY